MRKNQNFEMVNGDTKTVVVTVPFDLSGATIKWIMHLFGQEKLRKETPVITVTQATSTESKAEFKLESADTVALVGEFNHEMEVTDALGNVSTVMTGKAKIERGYIV